MTTQPYPLRLRDARADCRPEVEADLLRAIVETMPVGVSLQAADGSRVFANDAARDLDVAGEARVETTSRALEMSGETFTVTTSVDVSRHKQLADELFNRAYLDELTGLPNRALCEQSAIDMIATLPPGERFALAFVDLDNFKHINDFYSHAAGDGVLVKVAERISATLRPGDLAARIGGDEFVLLLTPIPDAAWLQKRLDLLSATLKQPVFVDGYEIFVSASIGAAIYPNHGDSYDLVRRSADNAMYRIKSGVKGGVSLFDDSMKQAATGRMAIEQRFRLAVRDRRFCCAYQPKVDIRTQAVVGVEVLLRWRDEQGVIQPPGHFVALAIELGLINEITHLMLAEVIDSIEILDATFGPKASISMNIAAKQAEDFEFMGTIVEALAESGHAHRFMIELTEEAFFTKSRFQAAILPRLKAIGTKVSIDDFGAGYSSLSALADITADEIKIDRAFITEIHKRPRSQIVLKAIEALGRSLGMTVIAEGVETFEELVWLQAQTNIHHAQGFYFSKPMLLPDVELRALDRVVRQASVGRHQAPARIASLRG